MSQQLWRARSGQLYLIQTARQIGRAPAHFWSSKRNCWVGLRLIPFHATKEAGAVLVANKFRNLSERERFSRLLKF